MKRVIGERDISDTRFSVDDARILYRDMVRARRFDERALSLQRRGWMSGYPPFRGQEASQVGCAHALDDDDWLFPTYRSNAMLIARGVSMSNILLFRRGYPEYTSDLDKPNFTQSVPIATQIPHATGAGMAANYKEAGHSVLCYFGDGATSEGDFHEGLNFAGVFDAPLVFFCENNNWAISLPRYKQTASETLAQKATAYGIEGVQVDGNDPLAVRETVEDALEKSKNGEPVMIESLTYRHGAHTTSDDPERYREIEKELPDWRTTDPLERYEDYLRNQGVIDDTFVERTREDAESEIDESVEEAESADPLGPEYMFEHVYHEMTPELREQKEWLLEYLSEG